MGETIDKRIESVLKDERITAILSEVGKEKIATVSRVSSLIGEVFTFCFVHSSDEKINIDDVTKYVSVMREAYFECHGDEKMLLDIRAKELEKSIAKTLNLEGLPGDFSKEDEEKIKTYFLENYVENGYVMHSFPGACEKSIRENGFSSSKRIWDNDEIMEIAKIFEDKDVISPVGGYSHYLGGGMYVENNPRDVYWHALSAPEWFKWFTSANHNKNSSKIEDSPYYLKNYDGCKQNVQDLCNNAGLSGYETDKVMQMFENNWKMLGTEKMCVALIPKKTIDKGNIDNAIIPGQTLTQTIKTVLADGRGQFTEHHGNVLTKTLTEKDMLILELPNGKELFGEYEFNRETKEMLYDPKLVLDMVFRGTKLSGFELSESKIESIIQTLMTVHNYDAKVVSEVERFNKRVSLFDTQEIGKATYNVSTRLKEESEKRVREDGKEKQSLTREY